LAISSTSPRTAKLCLRKEVSFYWKNPSETLNSRGSRKQQIIRVQGVFQGEKSQPDPPRRRGPSTLIIQNHGGLFLRRGESGTGKSLIRILQTHNLGDCWMQGVSAIAIQRAVLLWSVSPGLRGLWGGSNLRFVANLEKKAILRKGNNLAMTSAHEVLNSDWRGSAEL